MHPRVSPSLPRGVAGQDGSCAKWSLHLLFSLPRVTRPQGAGFKICFLLPKAAPKRPAKRLCFFQPLFKDAKDLNRKSQEKVLQVEGKARAEAEW